LAYLDCRLCGEQANRLFEATIRKKDLAEYYLCTRCGLLQIGDPHWLTEAYKEPINVTDTGIVQRNIALSYSAAILICMLFDPKAKYLDYAGGYGLLTRIMRDYGFDFLWHDPFADNIFAKGFEYVPKEQKDRNEIEMVTAFECFEHFSAPSKEIAKIFKYSRNLLASTLLFPEPIPKPEEWWYYGLEHGQHICFYAKRTLEYIARSYGVNIYSANEGIHLFTPLELGSYRDKFPWSWLIARLRRFPGILKNLECHLNLKTRNKEIKYLISEAQALFESHFRNTLKSKTLDDMFYLKDSHNA
jgi:hypothetical protein